MTEAALPDGVYYDLPEADYHALPRVSQSLLKWIHVSTYDCWARSWMGYIKPKETIFMTIGSAYHKAVLEGEEAFNELYAAPFAPPDDVPAKTDDMKALLKQHGQKVSGTKAVLAERLASIGIVTAGALEAEYVAANEGKTFLDQEVIDRLLLASRFIRKHPLLQKLVTGGQPEVTILWTDAETGLPCKARLDYLKKGAVVDLKTFTNQLNKPIQRAVSTAFASYSYHLQGAMYLHAADVAGEQGWIDEAERQLVFLFQQTGDVPLAIPRILPRHSTVLGLGSHLIRDGLDRFKACLDKFGPDVPWVDDLEIEEFQDTEFPAWIGEL